MPAQSKATETMQQIDELIEQDQLTTRTGLRLSFSTLRDAISVINDVDKKIVVIEEKINTMWLTYGVIKWGMAVLGVSVIGLIWSLLTGQASIVFGKP